MRPHSDTERARAQAVSLAMLQIGPLMARGGPSSFDSVILSAGTRAAPACGPAARGGFSPQGPRGRGPMGPTRGPNRKRLNEAWVEKKNETGTSGDERGMEDA